MRPTQSGHSSSPQLPAALSRLEQITDGAMRNATYLTLSPDKLLAGSRDIDRAGPSYMTVLEHDAREQASLLVR
jgi:hypothetical protein